MTDRTLLTPLFNKVHTSIRSVDDKVVLLYEPTVVPDTIPLGGGLVIPIGFQQGPGGPAYNDRQGLSYHVYCCGSGPDMCDNVGNPPPSKYAACDKFNAEMVRVRDEDAKRVNGGGNLLSEFGACTNSQDCVAEITRTTTFADAKLHGWAYWQYKFFNDVTTQSGDQEGFYNSDGTVQVSSPT
jgi:endoglycosylceramidase